jgi:hypothetical protein
MNVEIIAPSVDPTFLPAIKTILGTAIAANSPGGLRLNSTRRIAAMPEPGTEEPIVKLVILRAASHEHSAIIAHASLY